MASGTVTAEVHYLKKLPLYEKEKPFQLFIPVDKTAPDPRQTNLEFEAKSQKFVDIRENANDFTLDGHGFQVKVHPSAISNFGDRALIESEYFKEVYEILNEIVGGYDKVHIFDWRLRNSDTPREEVEKDMNDYTTWLRPSPTVHVDQSPSAVLHRVLLHFPDEAAFLLQGRVRIVNVWRPIENTVEDYPLGFCDPSSVPDEDLVECDHIRKKFKGANLYAHYNPEHEWYYLGEQRPEEVLLLKMFDSDPRVKATRCPHASFHHPSPSPDSKPRKSIEVRALLFNYPNRPGP